MDDTLGDRMKSLEGVESGRRFSSSSPVLARLDGRNFSRFTRGLRRPYDPRLTELMIDLTIELVRESGARLGYTQSDEITLVMCTSSETSQLYFDGRVQKMCSSLAAHASAWFNRNLPGRVPEKFASMPSFDCRVWSVPTLEEAADCIRWRELDASRNAITMAAREYYSHTTLHGVGIVEKLSMLAAKGVRWVDYPVSFRRGTYVRRVTRTGRFTTEEIDRLPPKHQARQNPSMEVERSEITIVDMPPLGTIKNKRGVLFDGEEVDKIEHAQTPTNDF